MDQQLERTFLLGLEENQEKLLRVCSVYAKDAETKEDLFQEVLINIWQAMPSFKGNSSLSTWMFRITLNVCLRLRTKQEQNRARFQSMDNVAIAKIEYEQGEEEDLDRLSQLTKCVKKLNDLDKAIVSLYLEQLPYKEMSEITGLQENTIATRVKRIKVKLLKCMTQIP
jgi:RNA polymerase sigma-70 factor (ECF subfamily)